MLQQCDTVRQITGAPVIWIRSIAAVINPPTATDISILTAAIKLLETVKSDLAGAFTLEHLNAAEPWPDRFECLKWAVENRATVAEMKAWHRAQNHMDLFKDDGVN